MIDKKRDKCEGDREKEGCRRKVQIGKMTLKERNGFKLR